MGNNEFGYNFSIRELFWQKFWDEERIYHFDPASSRPLYSIDTPPPTISGFLHLGHVFSYTQAEVVARYYRMAGYNVRYPFGLDNNGLPTERLVEKERGIHGSNMKLQDFARICIEVTEKYKQEFENLWKSLGFSYDWNLEYSTISPEVQRISQTVFKKLYDKSFIYRKSAPALYCHECHTSVAQAEVEDNSRDSVFYDIAFIQKNGSELLISTTRPELLPACVAVFVHPNDPRYTLLIGSEVETPLGDKVPVIADEKVVIGKGTGAVMCCTYGDETDMYWVRKYGLPEKIIIDKSGNIGEENIAQAQKSIIERLRAMRSLKTETPIIHDVGVHERCGTPIEIIPITQWFVRILDAKDRLIAAADDINWHPAYMKKRYVNWVEGLNWNWCISRERFFGVPIPAYICKDCSQIVIPDATTFPVDPKTANGLLCGHCNGSALIPEQSVLDTWFTSALTPDINNNNKLNKQLDGVMYPMMMRPQAHDIIRTWAVYSILMGLYLHDEVPWRHLMISGHVLVKKGEKISKKTGGGKYKPEELIGQHSADAIRYAMCSAGLGKDAYYDENQVKDGKKLVTKLYNAGKFVFKQLEDYEVGLMSEWQTEPLDQWIVGRLADTATRMQSQFERYEVGQALQIFQNFFWNEFTDNYLEMAKGRLYGDNKQKRRYAQSALYTTFLGILKLAAPFVPHITEELYHTRYINETFTSNASDGLFATNEAHTSIHLSNWPSFEIQVDERVNIGAENALKIILQVRKHKGANQIRLGEQMGRVVVISDPTTLSALRGFEDDIISTARASELVLADGAYSLHPTDLVITL